MFCNMLKVQLFLPTPANFRKKTQEILRKLKEFLKNSKKLTKNSVSPRGVCFYCQKSPKIKPGNVKFGFQNIYLSNVWAPKCLSFGLRFFSCAFFPHEFLQYWIKSPRYYNPETLFTYLNFYLQESDSDEEFMNWKAKLKKPKMSMHADEEQVWPLAQFFMFPFCENSLICSEGKSMTPSWETLFCSVPPSNSLVSVSDPGRAF